MEFQSICWCASLMNHAVDKGDIHMKHSKALIINMQQSQPLMSHNSFRYGLRHTETSAMLRFSIKRCPSEELDLDLFVHTPCGCSIGIWRSATFSSSFSLFTAEEKHRRHRDSLILLKHRCGFSAPFNTIDTVLLVEENSFQIPACCHL